MKEEKIKKAVREGYAKIAKQVDSCCSSVSCCGGSNLQEKISKKIGYSEEELKEVPEDSNLGLGCGNPVALASLREGEVVLDLGSGGGFDCFLAARRVGERGKVIGVDMTPEMIDKARENARKGGYRNVEFRLGEIENLPVANSFIDVVISNCVINLSTDKARVFKEAFRVLKPGGRLMISDIVLVKELPEFIKNSIGAYVGCLSGAIMKDRYIRLIEEAGFKDIKIVDEIPFPLECMLNDPTAKAAINCIGLSSEEAKNVAESVVSINLRAVKP